MNENEKGRESKNMVTLGWPPLNDRRGRAKLSMLYIIRNDLIFVPHDHLIRNSRNSKPDFYVPPSSYNVDAHLYNFSSSAGRLWNTIPSELKSSPSLDIFKGKLEDIAITHLRDLYTN